MNNEPENKNETQATDSCAPMRLMAAQELPTALRLAICEQRLQSTQRHKDAIEGLAIDHHRHIEQLTEQLYYERTHFEQNLDLARKEIEVLKCQLEQTVKSIEAVTEPQRWAGNVYIAPELSIPSPVDQLKLIVSFPKDVLRRLGK